MSSRTTCTTTEFIEPEVKNLPYVHVEVSVDTIPDKYVLTVVVSNPSNFTDHYAHKHVDAAFIYRRVAGQGDSQDEFVRVIKLDDIEAIKYDTDALGTDEVLYRTERFSAEYTDIQAAVSAREVIIHDLYVAYNDITAVLEFTKLLTKDEIDVPKDINSEVIGLINTVIALKSKNIELQALVDARAAEYTYLEDFRTRARILMRDLSMVKLTMEELGSPADLVAVSNIFETFKTDLTAVDEMYNLLATHTNALLANVGALETGLDTASNSILGIRQDVLTSLNNIQGPLRADLPTDPIAMQAVVAIDELKTDIEACYAAMIKPFNDVGTQLNTDLKNTLVDIQSATTHVEGQRLLSQYEAARNSVSQASTIIKTLLLNVAPEVASLGEMADSMTEITGRVSTMLTDVKEDKEEKESEKGKNTQEVSRLIMDINKYLKNFTEKSPLFNWSVTIQLPKE